MKALGGQQAQRSPQYLEALVGWDIVRKCHTEMRMNERSFIVGDEQELRQPQNNDHEDRRLVIRRNLGMP